MQPLSGTEVGIPARPPACWWSRVRTGEHELSRRDDRFDREMDPRAFEYPGNKETLLPDKTLENLIKLLK